MSLFVIKSSSFFCSTRTCEEAEPVPPPCLDLDAVFIYLSQLTRVRGGGRAPGGGLVRWSVPSSGFNNKPDRVRGESARSRPRVRLHQPLSSISASILPPGIQHVRVWLAHTGGRTLR